MRLRLSIGHVRISSDEVATQILFVDDARNRRSSFCSGGSARGDEHSDFARSGPVGVWRFDENLKNVVSGLESVGTAFVLRTHAPDGGTRSRS